jgi:trk system potassium uptake protein TrkH
MQLFTIIKNRSIEARSISAIGYPSPEEVSPVLTGSSFTKRRRRFATPTSLPVLTFAGLIIIGTALLLLPVAADPPLPAIDALFTATSVVCVTGLVVVDTGSRLSLFGQWVVMILIQCGGLGIMTFSTVLILLLGGRFSLTSRSVIHDTFTFEPSAKPVQV